MKMLFPNRCPSCMKVQSQKGICKFCAPFVRKLPLEVCEKCGRETVKCVCKDEKFEFDEVFSALFYDDIVRQIIHNFKFYSSKCAGDYLSDSLIEAFDEKLSKKHFDMILPVPADKAQKRYMGFTPTEYLCKNLSLHCGIEYGKALRKTVKNNKQHRQSVMYRSGNVYGVYEADVSLVKDKDILLVDDLLTTGNTASACAKILKIRGAKSVTVLTSAIADTEHR